MAVLSWNLLDQLPGSCASGMWLMQDGSVLANLLYGTQLMVLRPDRSGSYANGTWNPAGSNFLAEKAAYAAAVLSDGRLVTCGGEYNSFGNDSNFCEIYDPSITQTSTSFAPPPGWNLIGDAPSAVLNDGMFLLGNAQCT